MILIIYCQFIILSSLTLHDDKLELAYSAQVMTGCGPAGRT